jgi:DNA-binding transcriptional LysR family regulator
MDVDWEDIKTVLYLVRGRSLAQAGVRLGVNYTTVARRIKRIEAALGQQLFLKAKAGYTPTEAGLQVAKAAAGMEEHDHSLQRVLSASQDQLTGVLKITTPPLLVGPCLAEVIKRFGQKYPKVIVDVRATTETLDLNRPDADIAIRISNNPDAALVGQRLAKQRTGFFASDEYAKTLINASDQPIVWLGLNHQKGPPHKILEQYPNIKIAYQFDDMTALIGAVQNGLGFVQMPMFLGGTTRGLVQLPLLPPQPYKDIWVLTHSDLRAAPKITAFKKILIPYFKEKASEFWGQEA